MEFIQRELEKIIAEKIQPGKVVIISGARRVGKTVLVNTLIKQMSKNILFLNGEDINTHLALEKRSVENYKNLLGSKEVLVIDEAQNIPEIGKILKLIVDEFPSLKVIVTGSSAFDIHNLAGEPLTGRKYTYVLFPLSERELSQSDHPIARNDILQNRLIYGNYPELIHLPGNDDKREYLTEIVSSYLLKDILAYENIKSSSKIINLLRLVAFQIGNEVSLQELGNQLTISKNTVEKYLDLFTKVFILFKIEGLSRNLRKEISKNSRYYFYDNGIRNALIANFNSLELRNDVGQLWENYAIVERLKFQQYSRMSVNNYFWRTYDQQEIDWVEEREGKLYGYEMKWGQKKIKMPATWQNAYPESEFEVISRENYRKWIEAG